MFLLNSFSLETVWIEYNRMVEYHCETGFFLSELSVHIQHNAYPIYVFILDHAYRKTKASLDI